MIADAFLAVILGLPLTLAVTAAAFAVGLIGGIPLMLGLRSRIKLVSLPCRLLVDVIRGIPPIVWLFLIYFGVQIGAIRFDSFAAAVIGLGLIACAYLAEIYRGAFITLPNGQKEAADALGLHGATTFTRILTPQAFRTALPSMATYLLSLIKDSSIASTIGVVDMVFMANQFVRQSATMVGITPFVIAAVIYLLISLPIAIASRRLDARLKEARA
ncbi:MAG: amino acid ABC transporter permease [Gulosibacter sp.]|uniref:amino acid ABC transporter permease n=1 Tax=Gulosibacter sp. TaxID=2817531 RepID=UPI003F92357D